MKQVREGYKMTELGEIPQEWEVKELDKITDVRDGTHDSPKYLNTGIPFITSKNLKEYGIDFREINYISNDDHEKFSKRSKVDDGDIIFGMIGTIGNPVIVKKTFDFSIKNVALIKFNKDNIKNTYILNLLKSEIIKKQFNQQSNGGVQKFVSLNIIRKLKIPVPPLPEQKKIASILSKVDEQIELTDNLIEKTKDLKKGLMQNLLTKGIGHTEFKETEIGKIPTGWDVKRLNEICSKVTIGLVKTMTKFYVENGVPLIRNSNIKENKIVKQGMVFLEKKFSSENKDKLLIKGDIVTVHTGDIGTSAVIDNKFHNSQGFATLNTRVDSNIINNYFLCWFFNSEIFKKQAYSFSTGDGRNNLNLKDFVNSLIIVPDSLEEQKKIASILSSVDNQIEEYQNKKSKLEELKKGLMQQLLTGKIRVKVDSDIYALVNQEVCENI